MNQIIFWMCIFFIQMLINCYLWYRQFRINKYYKEILDYQSSRIRLIVDPPILTKEARKVMEDSLKAPIRFPI